MKKELFDYIKDITYKKPDLSDDDLVGYPQFMINRVLSMTDAYLPVVQMLNKIQLDNKSHYIFLRDFLPQRKVFSKYLKSKNDMEKETSYLRKYFEVGQRDAESYLDILTNEQIKEIINKYEIGKR